MKEKVIIPGLISVVMPVFNTGQYLYEGINSVLAQTYSDFELICVDDFSTDDLSRNILRELDAKHEKMSIYLFDKHVGAAESRNKGMELASGEYIIFLDADDYYDANMLDEMLKSLQKEDNADVCICKARRFDNETNETISTVQPKEIVGVTNHCFSLKDLPDDGLGYIPSGPCTKLIRRDLLIENKIKFQSLNSCNDVSFHIRVMMNARGIVYCGVDRPLQHVRRNTDFQITSHRSPWDVWSAIWYALAAEQVEIYSDYYYKIVVFMIKSVFGEIQRNNDKITGGQAYQALVQFVIMHNWTREFSASLYNYYLEEMKKSPESFEWLERGMKSPKSFKEKNIKYNKFDIQLMDKKDYIISHLSDKKVVIWGNGKRSIALQRLCRENGIGDIAIVDKKNENIGELTVYGYEIMHTDDVFNFDILVASNTEIYKDLSLKFETLGDVHKPILWDLQLLCPL